MLLELWTEKLLTNPTDLPNFARICLEAILAFVMVENDFKWKIKMF